MNTTNHINTSNSNPWKLLAPCCVLAAGCLWGIIGLFSNTLRGMGLDPVQITELRSLIAAAGLLIIILHKDRSLFRIHLRDLWMFLGTGIASIAFFNICYFLCITLSTLSIACTLLYTGPCFVMILSCLIFREKFTPKKAVALVLAVGGCTFITGLVSGGRRSFYLLAGDPFWSRIWSWLWSLQHFRTRCRKKIQRADRDLLHICDRISLAASVLSYWRNRCCGVRQRLCSTSFSAAGTRFHPGSIPPVHHRPFPYGNR